MYVEIKPNTGVSSMILIMKFDGKARTENTTLKRDSCEAQS